MAFYSVPDGVLGDGKLAAWFVPRAAITDPTNGSQVMAAITGTSAVMIACHLTQQPTPDVSTETIQIDRVCLPQIIEKNGRATWTFEDFTYVYDIQNPGSDTNEVYEAMVEGSQGWVVLRYLLDSDVAPAAAQVVDVFPVELSIQVKLPLTRNTEAQTRQGLKVDGTPARDVALAAA